MDRTQIRADLVRFLGTIARPGQTVDHENDDLHLFDAGLLDSLAVIQIILHLEQNYGVRLADQGVDPTELATIRGIMDTIERA